MKNEEGKKFANKYRIDSARLKDFDYSLSEAYFITICTQDHEYYFGDVVDDKIKKQLAVKGVSEFPETDTTHARRNNLINFAQKNNGNCTAEEVMKFKSICDESNPGSINRHNHGTVCLTFANPQNDPKSFCVMQPHIESEFKQLRIP